MHGKHDIPTAINDPNLLLQHCGRQAKTQHALLLRVCGQYRYDRCVAGKLSVITTLFHALRCLIITIRPALLGHAS